MAEKEQKIKKLIGFSKWEIAGIIAMLIAIIAAPYLFSQLSWGVSFENTGPIGDTIGGITAPFVNLLAAYLVYKSFSAQIEANTQLREDHRTQMLQVTKEYQFNYIRDLYNLISDDYGKNSKNEENESWAMGLVNLVRSFDDPNSYCNYYYNGKGSVRKSKDEIQDIINDELLLNLDVISAQVNNFKIFADAIRKVEFEIGLKDYYTRRIEDLIKDSEIWILLEKDEQLQFHKHDLGSISKVGSKEKNNFLCALNYIDE